MAQLAQANVARLRAPLDDPSMRDFVAALLAVNALAERSPASSGGWARSGATGCW